MSTPAIAKFKDHAAAFTYCKRVQKAYPKMKFGVMNHPQQFFWAVARFADNGNRVHCWVSRPRNELPGEQPRQWMYFLDDTPYNKSGAFWAPEHMQRCGVMAIIKKQLGLRGQRGRTKWSGRAAEFKPYGRKARLTISMVVG